jgi:uncharacterized protein
LTKVTPIRSCVGCGKRRAKKELVRLAVGDARMTVDPTGKSVGRGAYLCPRIDCFDAALKKNRLPGETRVLRQEFEQYIKDRSEANA